jgi:hypothetical protein
MDGSTLNPDVQDTEKLHRILSLMNTVGQSLIQDSSEPLKHHPEDVTIAIVLFAAQFMKRSGMSRERYAEFAKQAWDAKFDAKPGEPIEPFNFTFPDAVQ